MGWFPSPYVQEVKSDAEHEDGSSSSSSNDNVAQGPQRSGGSGDGSGEGSFRQHVVDDMLTSEYKFVTEMEQLLKTIGPAVRQLASVPDKAKRALLGNLFRVVEVCVCVCVGARARVCVCVCGHMRMHVNFYYDRECRIVVAVGTCECTSIWAMSLNAKRHA